MRKTGRADGAVGKGWPESMSKEPLNWNKMVRLLGEYRAKYGHCAVPAQWRPNPQLGRWVSALRYRRKMKDLNDDQCRQLDALGFVWGPNESIWDNHFRDLEKYKKRYGHCNVPTQWKRNRILAAWVSNQRTLHRKGKLGPDRVRRLNELGFEWSLYGARRREAAAPGRRMAGERTRSAASARVERIYCLGNNVFVQHDGQSPRPPELERYAARNGGEMPPFIPLPVRRTRFFLPHPSGRGLRKVAWSASGPLPEAVLEFLRDNGTLPAYG